MEKNKTPKTHRKITNIKDRKVLIAIIVGVAATVIGSVITYTQAQNANPTPAEIINIVTPIHPQVIVVKDKVTSVNGVALTEVARTATSSTIERVDGVSRFVDRDGQAQVSLLHGLDPSGQHIIAVTVTNTDVSPFYLTTLGFEGGNSETRISTLSAFAVDMIRGVNTVENYPKAPIIDPVTLNPNESLSAYIMGKWNIAELNKPIDTITVGATYYYELGLDTYKFGNVWNIGISDYAWRPAEKVIEIGYELRMEPNTVTLTRGQYADVLVKIWNLDPVERTLRLYLTPFGQGANEENFRKLENRSTLPTGITATFEKNIVKIPPIPEKGFYSGRTQMPDENAITVKLTIATTPDIQAGTYELSLTSFVDFEGITGVGETPVKLKVVP